VRIIKFKTMVLNFILPGTENKSEIDKFLNYLLD
jgi:hypothetical protein